MSNLRVQYRRGTTEEWSASRVVLLDGEPGLNIDNREVRIGDGVHLWADLKGESGGGGGSATPTFVHSQVNPAASWFIAHGTGRRTLPTILLDAEPQRPIFTDVEVIDGDHQVLIFPSPVSGKAYYN